MDLTSALARLLTDASLRDAYRRNRTETARRLSIQASDLAAFLRMDFESLKAQARTLLNKRFHEVSRIAPETIERLGAEGRAIFQAYAQTHWPEGHRRHLDDAIAFCSHLFEHQEPGLCRSEFHRLRFGTSRRRLAVHLVRDLIVDGRPRHALQILYRARDRSPRQLAWIGRVPIRFGRRAVASADPANPRQAGESRDRASG